MKNSEESPSFLLESTNPFLPDSSEIPNLTHSSWDLESSSIDIVPESIFTAAEPRFPPSGSEIWDSDLTAPSFASLTKPFLKQEPNNQNSVALCLAVAIEGSANPDVAGLRKLLPRLEKLAKCESFKAKAAILALVGSFVVVEGVLSGSGKNAVKNLIACLTEFLSTDDWAARKAAAEALMKMAAVEKHALSEYKASCLKTFESKRFDKVKAVRETMNQMVEAWKEIPDLMDEISPSSKVCNLYLVFESINPFFSKRAKVAAKRAEIIAWGADYKRKLEGQPPGYLLQEEHYDYLISECAKLTTKRAEILAWAANDHH